MRCECEICGETGESFEDYRQYCWSCHPQVVLALSDEKQNGWSTIETAPKDGTMILGYEQNGIQTPMPMQWVKQYGQHAWDMEERWWDYFGIDYWNPTHWMPLPEPVNE